MMKILITPKGQYGYNTDYFKMANYLAEQNLQVDILCFDQGFTKIDTHENVNVIYINNKKSKLTNYINYNTQIVKYVLKRRNEYNWIVVSGTIEYCGAIPLMLRKLTPRTLWIMDIRTCAVFNDERKRRLYDSSMLWSAKFFNHTTIISDLVAKRLKITNYTLLPLGADCIVDITKKKLQKEKINFLYVGTFEGRNIDNVIKAFDIFSSKVNNKIQTKLDIVGFSYKNSTQEIVLAAMKDAKNNDKIIYHGRKAHDEIKELFQEATVGISYVPITEYYDVQPPTKTFEYILNGLICIGTNTKANAQIINNKNGVLTNDDIDSVVRGMEKVLVDIYKFNILEISSTVEDYTWIRIEERFYNFLIKSMIII